MGIGVSKSQDECVGLLYKVLAVILT